jgi:hypothetical protein
LIWIKPSDAALSNKQELAGGSGLRRLSMTSQGIPPSCEALESRARRAAERVGLVARKSRRHRHPGSTDGFRGFQLVDPDFNWVIAGEKFNLSAEDIIEMCNREPAQTRRRSFY